MIIDLSIILEHSQLHPSFPYLQVNPKNSLREEQYYCAFDQVQMLSLKWNSLAGVLYNFDRK